MGDYIYLQGLSEPQLFEQLGKQLKSEESYSDLLPIGTMCCAYDISDSSSLVDEISHLIKIIRIKSKKSYELGIKWFNDNIPTIKESICIHPLTQSLGTKEICTQEVIAAIVDIIHSRKIASVEVATIVAFIIINRGINTFCKDYY